MEERKRREENAPLNEGDTVRRVGVTVALRRGVELEGEKLVASSEGRRVQRDFIDRRVGAAVGVCLNCGRRKKSAC